MIPVGERLGKYEILARLKAGGMGVLYLGRGSGAAGFERPVAIKIVHPHLSNDADLVRMFFDEAKLAASISHPNVVPVEELGEIDGIYYLVMPYIHGCSLFELLRHLETRGRALAPELATNIAIQIADGLHAAHEARSPTGLVLGLVHRDVSPHNVLIGDNGHVTLIDFGIAKTLAARNSPTEVGALKGKLRYMPPEQARGQDVDRRADIYALGIVLWEMLTMRRYFDGEDTDVLRRVRSPNPIAPSAYADNVPPALDEVVLRALSPDPEARPATAREFRRALGKAVPEALQIDEEPLANVVAVLLGDELEQRRAALPKTFALEGGRAPVKVVRGSDGTLAVMTRSGERRTETDVLGQLTRAKGEPLPPEDGQHGTLTGTPPGADPRSGPHTATDLGNLAATSGADEPGTPAMTPTPAMTALRLPRARSLAAIGLTMIIGAGIAFAVDGFGVGRAGGEVKQIDVAATPVAPAPVARPGAEPERGAGAHARAMQSAVAASPTTESAAPGAEAVDDAPATEETVVAPVTIRRTRSPARTRTNGRRGRAGGRAERSSDEAGDGAGPAIDWAPLVDQVDWD